MAKKLGLVSAHDREVMERWRRDLPQFENDDEGTPEWRASVVEHANAWRAEHGIPPLKEWWEDKPEPELHERARALGLLRTVS